MHEFFTNFIYVSEVSEICGRAFLRFYRYDIYIFLYIFYIYFMDIAAEFSFFSKFSHKLNLTFII